MKCHIIFESHYPRNWSVLNFAHELDTPRMILKPHNSISTNFGIPVIHDGREELRLIMFNNWYVA